MSENRIQIDIVAEDQASSVVAGAAEKMATALRGVESAQTGFAQAVDNSVGPLNAQATAQTEIVEKTKQATINYRDLTVGIAGVATASFALYNAWDNIGDMAVSVDRANLAVKTSANSVDDAQRRLTETLGRYGAGSKEAAAAQADLTLAQERNNVAVERADMLAGNYNETIVRGAISVLPSVITLTASLASIQNSLNLSTGVGAIAQTAYSWAKMLAVAPTATLTAAVWGLNAALLANPIMIVVVAIAALVAALVAAYSFCKPFKDAVDGLGKSIMDALKPAIDVVVGALTWFWENVLVPLGEFLLNVFIKNIEAVAGAIRWLADGIGALANWFGDAWAAITGTVNDRVEKKMADQLKIVEENLRRQTEEVNKRYDEQIKTVESAYAQETEAAIKSWEERLNVEAKGWDKVLKLENDNADKLLDAVRDALSDKTDAIEEANRAQLDSLQDGYNEQIDATNAFYDEMISTTKSKLKGVQSAREDDLNALELTYLLQKQVIEDGVTLKQMTSAEGEARLEALEKSYGDRRKTISEDYRVQELQAEIANKANVENAEALRRAALEKAESENTTMQVYLANDKKTKLAAVEEEANAEIKRLNEERNAIISEITADRDRIENKHTDELKYLFQKREDELTAITQKAADERIRITQDANARSLPPSTLPQNSGQPSLEAPQFRMGFGGMLIPVPTMAEGGLVTKPTLALIGEAGPEAVVPLRNLSAQESSSVQYNTIYINIPIGNITAEVPLEDVKNAVKDGVAEGVRRLS